MFDVNKPIKVSRGGIGYDARVVASDRQTDGDLNDDLKFVILVKDTLEEFVVYANADGVGWDVENHRDVEVYNPEDNR